MKPRLVPSLLLGLCTASCLSAQDPHEKARQALGKGAFVVVEIDGPARMKQAFEDTRVAKLLADPTLKALFSAEFEKLQKREKPQLPEGITAEELQKTLWSFNGRVMMSVGIVPKPGRGATVNGAMLLHDPQQQLAKLMKLSVEKFLEESDDYEEAEVEGRTLYIQSGKDGLQITAPFAVGNYHAMVFGMGAERRARDLISTMKDGTDEPGIVLTQDARKAGIAIQVDLGNVLQKMRKLDPPPPMLELLWKDIGLDALGTLSMVMAPKGQDVGYDITLRLREKQELGLMACLLPPAQRRSPLMKTFPFEISEVAAFYLDLAQLGRRLLRLANKHADTLGVEPDRMLEALQKQLGMRLQEDLLDHLSGDLFLMTNGVADLEDQDPLAAVSPYCLGVYLKDAKAFEAGLDKILRSRGLHAARKTRDYKGFKVRTINLAAFELSYVVTSSSFMVSLGAGGGSEAMRMVLTREAAAAKGDELPAMPKDMREAFGRLPSDHYSRNLQDLRGMMEAVKAETDFIDQEDLAQDAGTRLVLNLLRTLPPLMRKYGIKRSHATIHYKGRTLIQRQIF